MKILLLLAFLTWIIPADSFAQAEPESRDVIYLRNGSILRGEILEVVPDEYVRIRFSDSNELVIRAEEIKDIKRERRISPYSYNTSGYMNRSGMEILTGSGNNTFRFATIHGLHFNPHLSAGLGIGLTPYNDPLTLIPFFADFNYRLLKENTSPYLFLKAGYNFTVYDDDDDAPLNRHAGGLLLNPGIGIDINFESGFGWYIQAGYNIDQSAYEFETWGPQTVRTDMSFKRISVGMGLTF